MGSQLQTYEMALPIGSLDAYIMHINQAPMLSAAEEHDLAIRFRDEGDLEAARKLVMSHLRFVVKIARGYLGYGLPFADLIQEGSVGLMKAVKRFNPEVGVRLVSFAVHWIKAEIHEFIIKNWRIVKVATTKAQRKLFFNLRKAKKRLGWFTQEEVRDVANALNVPEKEVVAMEAKLSAGHEVAFDAEDDDEKSYAAPVNYLTDNSFSPEQIITNTDAAIDNRERMKIAFEKLDARSKLILQKRWLTEKKATLQDLAKELKVSAERIRQLEQMAITQLKKEMEVG